MSAQDNFTKGILLGTVIGGIAGAVTALLLAPKSGSELRSDIARRSSEFYDGALDTYDNLERTVGAAVNTTVNQGRERAQSIIGSAKTEAEKLLKNAEEILNDARSKAGSAKEHVEERISNLRDAAKASADTFKAELNKPSDV